MPLFIKNSIRNLAILILPFLIMILVNEFVRLNIKDTPCSIQGITAINSLDRVKDRCTWICHNQTIYCKQNHVKLNKKYFVITDKLYFGLINLLGSTGYYGLANILFLAIFFPVLMWLLLIKSINIQYKINELKKNE